MQQHGDGKKSGTTKTVTLTLGIDISRHRFSRGYRLSLAIIQNAPRTVRIQKTVTAHGRPTVMCRHLRSRLRFA
jgi:hypothetical protein